MLPGTPVDPEKRLYAYDPIGNRRTATEGSVSTTYSSNNLNQYTSVSAASVVNPVHDDDGNVTDYKTLKYSWNAENQMISAEPKNPTEGDKKTEYLYDYMGRRARKQVYVYSSGAWTLSSEKLFVYDGWNLVKEITKSGASSSDKFYVWGLDLSQSLQEAGGIGGLVCAVHAGEVRHFFYDANGNVGQVVNETGSIVARYEYDPFGNIVNGVSQSDDNPFRFSTKYFDAETGLYYYGYRYYSAELGRWWSRDPIAEIGGNNLYLFAGNNGISLYDNNGLFAGGLINPQDYVDKLVRNFDIAYEQIRYAVNQSFLRIEQYILNKYRLLAEKAAQGKEGRVAYQIQERHKVELWLTGSFQWEVSWGRYAKVGFPDCDVVITGGDFVDFKGESPFPFITIIPNLRFVIGITGAGNVKMQYNHISKRVTETSGYLTFTGYIAFKESIDGLLFGTGLVGFVEAGGFISGKHVYGSQYLNKLNMGVYVRAVAEAQVNFGGYKYLKRGEAKYSYGGNPEVF